MIDNRFVHYLKDVPPRSTPRLDGFLSFLSRRKEEATNRASYLTPHNAGSRLLIQIIKLADLPVLLNSFKTSRETGEYLLWISKELEKPLDARVNKHGMQSLFIRSRSRCYELVTSSRLKNPLIDIPFHLPYDNPEWQQINPFRIVDMSTTDLKLSITADQLIYTKQGPTYAIYSVDCIALVAKFMAYWVYQNQSKDIDQCLLNFVQNEIIVPTLLNDSTALWLRNIYRQQFLSSSVLESHTSTIWDMVNIDTIGSEFSAAMIDIQHLKEDLKKRSITHHTVLSSLPLTTTGQNVTSYYRSLVNTTSLPNNQPYPWVDCLKNLAWWEFILMVVSFTPDQPEVLSMKRDVIRNVRFWNMMKPWSEIYNSNAYRNTVEARLKGLLTYLETR